MRNRFASAGLNRNTRRPPSAGLASSRRLATSTRRPGRLGVCRPGLRATGAIGCSRRRGQAGWERPKQVSSAYGSACGSRLTARARGYSRRRLRPRAVARGLYPAAPCLRHPCSLTALDVRIGHTLSYRERPPELSGRSPPATPGSDRPANLARLIQPKAARHAKFERSARPAPACQTGRSSLPGSRRGFRRSSAR